MWNDFHSTRSTPSSRPIFISTLNPFRPAPTTFLSEFATFCSSITRQPIELENCSNPQRIRHFRYSIFLLLTLFVPPQPLFVRVCNFLQLHNSPADWARELFKPSTDSISLLYQTEKNLFRFGFGVLCVTSQWEMFSPFLAKYTWPWAPTQGAIFWLKSFCKLG